MKEPDGLKVSAFAMLKSKAKSTKQSKRTYEVNGVSSEDADHLLPENGELLGDSKSALKEVGKKNKKRKVVHKTSEPTTDPAITTSKKKRKAFVNESFLREDNEPTSSESHPKFNFESLAMDDSEKEAQSALQWIIDPLDDTKFFKDIWEQKPFCLNREQPDFYKGLFSTTEFDAILRQNDIQFSVNIDVTKYENDKRETLNQPGRAYAPVVWDHYNDGCSVRFLNPQSYSKAVWTLNSVLQERFGTFVGSNVYLTPPGTQGFAPHWDDIEAFILQLEGKKFWRVYPPRVDGERLPRFSSPNFSQADIGEPVIETMLEAGDLLYVPRGMIHQATTVPDAHSLHITLSCQQLNTWGDYLQKLIPRALETAMETNVEFRKSLPVDYMNYMGWPHKHKTSSNREEFIKKTKEFMKDLIDSAPIDEAVDEFTKKYMNESLPPAVMEGERALTIHGSGEEWDASGGQVTGSVEMGPDDEFRLIRKHCLRSVRNCVTV